MTYLPPYAAKTNVRFRAFAIVLPLLAALLYGWSSLGRVSAASTDSVTCSNLKINVSDDKNYYTFTVSTTGDNASITGYIFNFGDHQSYHYTFSSKAGQDHHTATATHSYSNLGTYTATASVVTKTTSKEATISSPACKTQVTIGPPVSTLVDTGAGNPLWLFMGTCTIGAVAHHLWLRRHSLAILNKEKTPPGK
jgi:hypothetical protein